MNGKAISLPEPAYPALAKAARVSGSVTVQVLIDETILGQNLTLAEAHNVVGEILEHFAIERKPSVARHARNAAQVAAINPNPTSSGSGAL